MATHSSILAWRIPCAEESGRLQSMGLPRVRYDTGTLTLCIICIQMYRQMNMIMIETERKRKKERKRKRKEGKKKLLNTICLCCLYSISFYELGAQSLVLDRPVFDS